MVATKNDPTEAELFYVVEFMWGLFGVPSDD